MSDVPFFRPRHSGFNLADLRFNDVKVTFFFGSKASKFKEQATFRLGTVFVVSGKGSSMVFSTAPARQSMWSQRTMDDKNSGETKLFYKNFSQFCAKLFQESRLESDNFDVLGVIHSGT
jgi:hypothetical protein